MCPWRHPELAKDLARIGLGLSARAVPIHAGSFGTEVPQDDAGGGTDEGMTPAYR